MKKENGQSTGKSKAQLMPKSPEFLANQWKPGQSGNPGGRVKKLTDRLEKQLEERVPNDPHKRSYAQLLIEATVKRAISKSDVLVKEIFDRVEGKLNIAITGDEEAPPVQINISAIPHKREQT